MKRVLTWIGVLACAAYLTNPTGGLFELIPDVVPLVGNLDEGAAGGLLLMLLQSLRKKAPAATQDAPSRRTEPPKTE